jgi:hypothetical protein
MALVFVAGLVAALFGPGVLMASAEDYYAMRSAQQDWHEATTHLCKLGIGRKPRDWERASILLRVRTAARRYNGHAGRTARGLHALLGHGLPAALPLLEDPKAKGN